MVNWLNISYSLYFGISIYTKSDIKPNHTICRTKVNNLNRSEGYINTPDGILFHHSAEPKYANCRIEIINDEFVEVISKRLIHEGEELLINYDINPHKRYDFHEMYHQK